MEDSPREGLLELRIRTQPTLSARESRLVQQWAKECEADKIQGTNLIKVQGDTIEQILERGMSAFLVPEGVDCAGDVDCQKVLLLHMAVQHLSERLDAFNKTKLERARRSSTDAVRDLFKSYGGACERDQDLD